ncbi:TIGR00730 family Rossman fold protein [Acidithiobacillus sp.]|uniref:LOG family protein n=1 Tax=Acidithiobacillus sp. TaxID=1872118 RepID=UPI0032AF5CAE
MIIKKAGSTTLKDELDDGYELLSSAFPAVAIFGSARIADNSSLYKTTYEICDKLSQNGFYVISGGGPGLMEAANKASYLCAGKSVGLNISLPCEQKPNKYQNISIQFDNFFTRKYFFMINAISFVVMPGGFGTIDELFDVLVMVQTSKAEKVPIILVGRSFWEGLTKWLNTTLIKLGTVSKEEVELLITVDNPDEVVSVINEFYMGLGEGYGF